MTVPILKTRDEALTIHCRESEYADAYRRIRDGDPILGWRGDEHAELWRREGTDGLTTFYVMMKDVKGDRYVATALQPGERLDTGMRLAAMLRDGDWQHGRGRALVAQQHAEQIAAEEYARQKQREHVQEEVAPKLWNIARTGKA